MADSKANRIQPKFSCPRCGVWRMARSATSFCTDCRAADPWCVKKMRAAS